MSPGTLRTARLEVKACLLSLGPWPWVAAALYLGATWIQEPSFFRQQQLDLAWPAAACVGDAISLMFISQLLTSPCGGIDRRARGLAGLLLVGCCTLFSLALGLGLDACFGRSGDPDHLLSLAVRPLALWPAVLLVGLGVTHSAHSLTSRLLWILFAFGVQASLLPADVRIWERSLHSWLAVVATFAAGSAFLTSTRLPRSRGDLPCA